MEPKGFVIASRAAPRRGPVVLVRSCAWLLVVMGLITLGYTLFAEFTLRLFRGGAIELGLGIFGLFWTRSWRRKPASPSA